MREALRGALLSVLFLLVVGGVPALGESGSKTGNAELVVAPTTNLCKGQISEPTRHRWTNAESASVAVLLSGAHVATRAMTLISP